MSPHALTPTRLIALAVVLALAVLLPLLANDLVLSVSIVALHLALLGAAWNIMMGYAGQLSLGHALYIGLGAYTAAVLFARPEAIGLSEGVSPWIGLPVAMLVAAGAGAVIGFLGFRFGIRGVQFALLTIAVAEFTRILFDHWDLVGASGGLFLPVAAADSDDLWNLRGSNQLFYYVILGFLAAALLVSKILLDSPLGYAWRAIREDEEAAAAMGINAFRAKMIAVMISGAITAMGGVFIAFQNNTLYPEEIFSIHTSIEILIAVIIGGIGTLLGPVVGAVVLTGFGEVLTDLADRLDIDGLKQLMYGVLLAVMIYLRPTGLWPWIQGLLERRAGGGKDG